MGVANLKPDVVYVLNKNEGIIGVFNKKDRDTLIDPLIKEVQNQEAELHFQIPASSKKWKNIYNPENLYLADNKIFSANFSDCIERDRDENGEDIISVKAYERQKLLEREFAKIYNSTTGFEELDDSGNPVENGKLYIDEFMVIILSNGDKRLINNDRIVPTTFEKGTSGYALQALLYGTGWNVGICDVEGKFDLELDQESIYDMVKKVQELWGGILVVDSLNKVIHHRDETKYLPYSGYEVKYKKNIQSNKYIGDNKIITELCPLGEGSLNIKSVNDGSIWLTNHEYTDSVLKAIENNDDIYDPEQLKRWGERKLKELCKPRRELQVTTALLKAVKGHEHEIVALNHIVDVIDYEFIEEKTVQLRVIAYEHFLWNDADAILEIGDITLESTDIFKKTISATNLINNGTLDTSKVIDYYKNGQSLKETLRQVDQVIISTKSELSKSDDEIRASVEQITSNVDNLNNDIISQSKTLAELIIEVGKISSKVETVTGLTEIITSHDGRVVLDKAVKGYLYGLSIHGYNGAFEGTLLSDDTILSDDTVLLDSELEFEVSTINKCPTDVNSYESGGISLDGVLFDSIYNIRSSKYIEVDSNYSAYFSIKGTAENNSYYVVSDIIYYDENKQYITTYCRYFDRNIAQNSNVDAQIVFTPNTKYIKFVFRKLINNSTTYIYPEEISNIKPQLEYCEKYKEGNIYSGELPSRYVRLKTIDNLLSKTGFSVSDYVKNTTEFEFKFKHVNSDSNYNIILGTDDSGFVFWNKFNGSFTNKVFKYHNVDYPINTQNEYYNVITTLTFKNNILTFSDENGNIESFEIPVAEEEFTSQKKLLAFSFPNYSSDNSYGEFYYIKIWENSQLISHVVPMLIKESGYIGYYDLAKNILGYKESYVKGYGTSGIEYFIKPSNDFIEHNSNNYFFELDSGLKIYEETNEETGETTSIYDEFTVMDKRATLIRRIGVDSEGNNYVLAVPKYIDYGALEIPIVQGTNVVEVKDYAPTIIAEYVKQNAYTDLFATKVETYTLIEQTDQKILLVASKKLSTDELIQEFNSQIAITPEKILIEGDKIIIRSSYFTLNADGSIIATKGQIAGWSINDNYLGYGVEYLGYPICGIDTEGAEDPEGLVFFSGKSGMYSNPTFAVYADGSVDLQRVNVWDKSTDDRCYIHLYNPNSQVGTSIDSSGIETYNLIAGSGQRKGQVMHGVENSTNGHLYGCWWSGSNLQFYIDNFNGDYQCWIDVGTSDERLKHDKKDIDDILFKIISEIQMKSYILNADEENKIRIGIIAQDLIAIAKKYDFDIFKYLMIFQQKSGYYYIDYEQIANLKIALFDKKIKELEKQNSKKDQVIKLLAEKLGCTEEIEKILNE